MRRSGVHCSSFIDSFIIGTSHYIHFVETAQPRGRSPKISCGFGRISESKELFKITHTVAFYYHC